jgi:hypothetical protein
VLRSTLRSTSAFRAWQCGWNVAEAQRQPVGSPRPQSRLAARLEAWRRHHPNAEARSARLPRVARPVRPAGGPAARSTTATRRRRHDDYAEHFRPVLRVQQQQTGGAQQDPHLPVQLAVQEADDCDTQHCDAHARGEKRWDRHALLARYRLRSATRRPPSGVRCATIPRCTCDGSAACSWS